MRSRWVLNRTNPEFISYLSRAAALSPLFSQILVSRGIKTVADIQDFLGAGLGDLSDPFELPGVLPAVERIRTARRQGERVFVHGDYDADGLTATAIMTSALRTAGLDAQYHIPHRMIHGYGFKTAGVDAAQQAGAALIITVDCGIGSFEAAAHAAAVGIDLIITDHHEPLRAPEQGDAALKSGSSGPGEEFLLPPAVAVINPKLSPQAARTAGLCGAGIAFKLAQAMALDREIAFGQEDLIKLLDLAALGTVADVVPLVGENRIIVREALKHIQEGSRPGMRALKQASGLDRKPLKAGLLSFTMAPRVNAAGRMGDAGDVVRLFLSDSDQEASDLASWLDRVNGDRQKTEGLIYQEALEQLAGAEPEGIVVLAKEGWHPGVMGIVASKIAESRNLPTFIFSIDQGIAKGSGRSIPAFDICGGLSECRELLITFGGHKQAAGVTLRQENLPAFEERMRGIILSHLSREELLPTVEIHAAAHLNDLNASLMRELGLLEPYGFGNPEPLLGARELQVINPKMIKEKHLKMRLKKGSVSLDAVGWGMGHMLEDLGESTIFDAVFTPAYNEWNGTRSIQLVLKGLRPSV